MHDFSILLRVITHRRQIMKNLQSKVKAERGEEGGRRRCCKVLSRVLQRSSFWRAGLKEETKVKIKIKYNQIDPIKKYKFISYIKKCYKLIMFVKL